jgi:ATP-dependent exoDNAse (exonuclease V) beta subunit
VHDNEKAAIRGGIRSEAKSILLAKGMQAADYGTLVHEVMRGKSPTHLLSSYHLDINEEEMKKIVQGLEEMYKKFMTSDVMMNRAEGGKDLKELPFELKEGNAGYMGIIDRLVQHKDGSWALIDYKSIDPLEGHVAEQVSAFREQMGIYTKAVSKMVGGKISEYIYLTETGGIVQL